MRRLKKAGLTLLISSLLLSNSAFYAFADQTATSPVITEVVPISTGSSTSETVAFDPSLGPGAPGAAEYVANMNASSPTESTEATVPEMTESTVVETAPAEVPASTPVEVQIGQTPEADIVQESSQSSVDETGPLSVPKRTPRLQTTVLLTGAQAWSSPFVNDQPVTVEDQAFSSISTF